MRCAVCGNDNPDSSLFCASCASSLAKQQLRTRAGSRVMLPPQDLGMPKSTPRQRSASPLPIIVLLLTLFILLWTLYG